MPWQIVILLSKFGSPANILSLYFYWPHHAACRILVPSPGIKPRPLGVRAPSHNHRTTKEFPILCTLNVMKCFRAPLLWSFFFANITSSEKTLPFSAVPFSPFMLVSSPSPNSSSSLSAVSWMMAVSASPWSPISSRTLFTFDLNFTSSFTTFCFFVWPFPLLIIFICKMSHGFITGRQRGNTITLFAVCEWTKKQIYSDQSLTHFERTDVICHLPPCTSVIYVVIYGLKSEQQSLYFMHLTQLYCGNWNLNCVIEGLSLFDEMVVIDWNSCVPKWYKGSTACTCVSARVQEGERECTCVIP